MQEMALKKILFFKILRLSMPPDPPKGSCTFGVSWADSCLPPKISKPLLLNALKQGYLLPNLKLEQTAWRADTKSEKK